MKTLIAAAIIGLATTAANAAPVNLDTCEFGFVNEAGFIDAHPPGVCSDLLSEAKACEVGFVNEAGFIDAPYPGNCEVGVASS